MEQHHLLQKRAELYVQDHLLRLGIDPFAPVSGRGHVDCLVPLANGGYREAIVVAEGGPAPRWFRVTGLRPAHSQFVVCVALPGENVETWVIPSLVFAESAERSGDAYDLRLDETGQAREMAQYRDAWHLLTEDALRSRPRPEA
jgi:hypothetical protein